MKDKFNLHSFQNTQSTVQMQKLDNKRIQFALDTDL